MNDGASATWSVVTFFGYTAAVFLLAILSHRLLSGRSFLKEYFLGSRGLGVWALAMTYAATSASGGSFTGFPAKIYEHGWILALWIASYMVVPIVCLGLLGKHLNQVARMTGAITLPDVLRDRFRSPTLGILLSSILAFFIAINLVAQFKAGGTILQVLLQDQPFFRQIAESIAWLPRSLYLLGDPADAPSPTYGLGLLLFAGGVVLYTAYGGFRAVVWTDVLQGLVMFVGVLILLPLAIYKAGGLGEATRHLTSVESERLGRIELRVVGPGVPVIEPGTAVRITIDGVAHDFRTVEPLEMAAEPAPDRTAPGTLLVRAEQPGALPSAAIDGAGEAIAIDGWPSGDGLFPDGYRLPPARSLVTGPGPRSGEFDGFLPLGLAISFFVMWAITGAGQPHTLVRLMAFKSSRVYKRSMFTVTFYYSLIYLPLVAIFVCARKIVPALDDPDQAMARTVIAVAPAVLAGILLAAPFAAVMSTVDSFLLMISSSLVRDIYQRSIRPKTSESTIRRLSYTTTVVVGVVVTMGALNPPMYLQDIIVFTSAGLASCFLAPMVYALYWKRATTAGIIAAIVGGFVALMALYAINWVRAGSIGPYNLGGFLPAVWGLVVSFVAGFVVSLVTPRPPRDLVRFYFSARR